VQHLPEAVKYTLLWETREKQRIRERKIFCVFMEMNIKMTINRKPWLSPMVYNNLQIFVGFKADFDHVFIRARKYPMKTWHEIPYLATNDVIFIVLESWPPKWHAPAGSVVEAKNSTS